MGAVYAVLLFFPNLQLGASLAIKFLVSMLMVFITFGVKRKWKLFFKTGLTFYILTFVFGGILFGILFLTNAGLSLGAVNSNGIFYINISTKTLFILSGISCVCLSLARSFIQRTNIKSLHYVDVEILLNGKNSRFTAMIDTANTLFDPLTSHPVVVTELDSLKNVFSPKTIEFLSSFDMSQTEHLDQLLEVEESIRFKIIPYHTLGAEKQVILGFSPDCVKISSKKETIETKNAVIGIYPGKIASSDEYTALMHPNLLNMKIMS